MQLAKMRKSEADAERSRGPPHDDAFVPPHVRAQFTIDSLEDLAVRNARELRNSHGAGAALAAAEAEEKIPFALPSMGAMLKLRAFMRRFRKKMADRPAEPPCIDLAMGDHVAVTRNQESIRRALAEPGTVRCVHLMACEGFGADATAGNGGDWGGKKGGAEEELAFGFWDAAGRWEAPAALRVLRLAEPGTPKHAKHVLCRRCFDRLQARRVASVASCRRCRMMVPRSVMVTRQLADSRAKLGTGAASPGASGFPIKVEQVTSLEGSGASSQKDGAALSEEELPLCIFCEKLERKLLRDEQLYKGMAIGPSPLQLEEMPRVTPFDKLVQRLDFGSPALERRAERERRSMSVVPVRGADETQGVPAGMEAETETTVAPKPLGGPSTPPRHRRDTTPGLSHGVALDSLPRGPRGSPHSAVVVSAAISPGATRDPTSPSDALSPCDLHEDADEDMSRLVLHTPGSCAPLPDPDRSRAVTPQCSFMHSEDVPDITTVSTAPRVTVRWDPITRVMVSTEKERRFLSAGERRAFVHEVKRAGPQDGLMGGAKETRLGFLKVGDVQGFVTDEFPRWDPQPM